MVVLVVFVGFVLKVFGKMIRFFGKMILIMFEIVGNIDSKW